MKNALAKRQGRFFNVNLMSGQCMVSLYFTAVLCFYNIYKSNVI